MHPFPGRYPKRCAESDSDATWKEKTSFALTFHPRLKSVALFDATSRIQEVRGIYGEREPRSIDERREWIRRGYRKLEKGDAQAWMRGDVNAGFSNRFETVYNL